MKKLLFCLALLFTARSLFAQTEALQLDENNKYVYYEVVEKTGLPADSLYMRGLSFISKQYADQLGRNKTPNAIAVKGKFVVYNNSLVSKKESGEIAYSLNVDTRDGRYRYKFGNFVFTPYKIDRYGNMVAVPGIYTPAEKLTAQVSKKDADSYLEQIGNACKMAASQLKQQMDKVQTVKKAEVVKKVDTDKW